MKFKIGDCLEYTVAERQIKGQPKIKEITTQKEWQIALQKRTRQIIGIVGGMYEFSIPTVYSFTLFELCDFVDNPANGYVFQATFN